MQILHFLHQPVALRALAHGDELDLCAAQFLPRFHKAVERIGHAVRTRVPDEEPAVFVIGAQFVPVNRRVVEGSFPIRLDDAVRHADEFFRLHAVLHKVLLGARQQGNDAIAVFAAIVFRLLHHTDVGVFRAHAAQFNRAQRPQIVHLIHQLRAGTLCQAVCGINVERIGGGGDDGVKFAAVFQFLRVRIQAAQKTEHVADAAEAVALIGVAGNPEIPDAVDLLLLRLRPAHLRVFRAQMRERAGRDGDGMAHLHPALRHEIRPVFHAVACTSCIVIDQKNVHRLASVSHAPQRMCAICSEAWPSPKGLLLRAAWSGVVCSAF